MSSFKVLGEARGGGGGEYFIVFVVELTGMIFFGYF